MFGSGNQQTGLLQFRVSRASERSARNHVACPKRICGLLNERISTCPQGDVALGQWLSVVTLDRCWFLRANYDIAAFGRAPAQK